jgi:hypothetical protein
MNCQTFSDLASDIARDQMMDAAARARALAHANSCVNCAARLRDQQHLTSDLRELVSATEDQTASTAVWESLSAAFDTRAAAHITTRRRSVYAAGAIAAMLILTLAVLQIVRQQQQPAGVQGSIAATFTPLPAQTPNQIREKDVIVSVNRKPQLKPRRNSPIRRALTPPINQTTEIATDFIPLTYGDPDVGSGAQMVRVELPRSAMASFGLPVNMDRADQRVKADVLLGADGLARAIRFVQ